MEKKSYPTIRDAIILYFFLLGIQWGIILIFIVILTLYGIGFGSQIYTRGENLIVILSYVYAIYRGYEKSHRRINEILKFNNVSLYIWLSIIIFIPGFIILSERIFSILFYLNPMPQSIRQLIHQLLQQTTRYIINEHLFVSLLLMVIIPAFTQETLFKGIILNGFSENYSQKKSIIISAVLYGIVEYAFSPFWLFVVAGFLYGIISAWIYLNTKSLVPGIFINMFIKAAYILLFKFSDMVPIAELEMAYTDHPFKLQWFDGIGLVLATAGIFLLVKSIKKHKTAIDDSI